MTETPDIVEDAPETTPAEDPTNNTTTDLTPQRPTYSTPAVIVETDQIRAMLGIAEVLADTEFVPQNLRGDKAKVFAAMMTGHGLGIDPMTSLRHVSLVQGSTVLSAKLQTALVRRAGHVIGGEGSATSATVRGKRSDNQDEMEVTFTWEMAESRGLTNQSTYKRTPEAMLYHRATTMLVDRLFADCVIGGALGRERDDSSLELEGT